MFVKSGTIDRIRRSVARGLSGSPDMPVAWPKQGTVPMAKRASQIAKGAHLGAVRGELRPVALLSDGWRSRRLLDSG
jgi:hypothetical protein